jgi:cytochrome c-type biogenesis protein CcmH/NrfF
MHEAKPDQWQVDALGVGFGLFLVLAGVLTLAEHAGIIPAMKWGVPIFWIVIGGVILYSSVRKR